MTPLQFGWMVKKSVEELPPDLSVEQSGERMCRYDLGSLQVELGYARNLVLNWTINRISVQVGGEVATVEYRQHPNRLASTPWYWTDEYRLLSDDTKVQIGLMFSEYAMRF